MIQKIKLISCIVLIFTLYSCRCDDRLCPALEAQYSQWVPYNHVGDTIRYINNAGDEINFVVNEFTVSADHNSCGPNGLGGCKCSDCPAPAQSYNAATKDTSRKITDSTGYTFRFYDELYTTVTHFQDPDTVRLTYGIFDQANYFAIHPVLKLNQNDSLLPIFTAGPVNYTNVILHQVDTTVINSPNPIYNHYFIWKSYYTREYGIIAFYDLYTQSFFYRKT